ncbi:MAG: GNAT family N-acetyltransferase [Candidatus Competibacteraceae bacterium]|nr:GNAT family N-acetyltransferase [Candidatus Competibacteraceae bacterium]
MRLRPYKNSDLESVAHLFTASIHGLAIGHYDATQRAAWAPRPPDLSEWNERLNGLHTVIAEDDDNELAGFLSYAMNGYIGLLYVSPRYPRRGVASLLYREIEAALLLAGIEALFTEASSVARPFFQRQGFLLVEEQIVSRRGVAFRRYAMRKSIKASG